MTSDISANTTWVDAACADLIDAAIGLDGDRMGRTMQETLEAHGADALVADVLVPVLRTIGEMWAEGSLSVMHEHHASSIIRSVIAQKRRHEVASDAPAVVLGCPPGELHDLPLHLFAIMLTDRGMRPVVLGASTPLNAVSQAIRATHARSCVLAGRRDRAIVAYRPALTRMARTTPLYVAGPASISTRDAAIGLRPLSSDWREAADTIRDAAGVRAQMSAG